MCRAGGGGGGGGAGGGGAGRTRMRADVRPGSDAPLCEFKVSENTVGMGVGLSVDILYTPTHLLNGLTNKPY